MYRFCCIIQLVFNYLVVYHLSSSSVIELYSFFGPSNYRLQLILDKIYLITFGVCSLLIKYNKKHSRRRHHHYHHHKMLESNNHKQMKYQFTHLIIIPRSINHLHIQIDSCLIWKRGANTV